MLKTGQINAIYAALNAGLQYREAARQAGTTHRTVSQFDRGRKMASVLPAEKRREVQRLLSLGFPLGAIRLRTKLSLPVIVAIQEDYANEFSEVTETFNGFSSNTEPHEILSDLIELEQLQLIDSPLFYDLAQRAKKVMEKNNDDKTQTAG